jgi:hypothetical protein
MKNLVTLELMLLFDPDSTWPHLRDFEKEFAEFLKTKGKEGEIVDTMKGQVGREIILVKKIQDVLDKPVGKIPAQFKNEKKINL